MVRVDHNQPIEFKDLCQAGNVGIRFLDILQCSFGAGELRVVDSSSSYQFRTIKLRAMKELIPVAYLTGNDLSLTQDKDLTVGSVGKVEDKS